MFFGGEGGIIRHAAITRRGSPLKGAARRLRRLRVLSRCAFAPLESNRGVLIEPPARPSLRKSPKEGPFRKLAEREGFEPSKGF